MRNFSKTLLLWPLLLVSCFSADLKELKSPALGNVSFTFTVPFDSARHTGTAMPNYIFALDDYMSELPVAWEDAQLFSATLRIISPASGTLSGFSDLQLYWLHGADSLNLAYYTEKVGTAKTLAFKPRSLSHNMNKLNGQPLYLSFNSPKLDSALRVEIDLQWICTGTLLK